MAALSAVVFSLSWWLGLYLLARDPRKPVLVLAAIGLTSFAAVVALDAVRVVTGSDVLGSIEIYLVAVPGIAWFAVLVELSRPRDTWRRQRRRSRAGGRRGRGGVHRCGDGGQCRRAAADWATG